MSIKTMQLGVSKNLLTKVPRYFGAPNAILRELFQNSYRGSEECDHYLQRKYPAFRG